jgi:hypothetical protein
MPSRGERLERRIAAIAAGVNSGPEPGTRTVWLA